MLCSSTHSAASLSCLMDDSVYPCYSAFRISICASCIPMCVFLVLYGIHCSTMCPISIILGAIAAPFMFHFVVWLMPFVIILYLPLSYQCPFSLFHSWSFTCLCFFPLVNIHVQMSITLNEFRYVTKCLASPKALFRYVWPLPWPRFVAFAYAYRACASVAKWHIDESFHCYHW